MCVAIHAPAGAGLIPFDDFEKMRAANDDGMGLMWAHGGTLHVVRQMKRLRRFWQRYKTLHDAGIDVVMHFRYATHGTKDMKNVHPIHIHKDLALVHNGILDGFSYKDPRSDTRQFVDTLLKHLPNNWYLKGKGSVWETIETLTAGSKFIFMDADGRVQIMHRKSGFEIDGNWFSSLAWEHRYWSYHIGGHGHGHSGWEESDDTRAWRAWWEKENGSRAAESNLGSVDPSDVFSPPPPGMSASAFIHWPSATVYCESCKHKMLPDEPGHDFQMLWSDKEPIVCDSCDRTTNMALLQATYYRQQEEVGASATGG